MNELITTFNREFINDSEQKIINTLAERLKLLKKFTEESKIPGVNFWLADRVIESANQVKLFKV